MKIIEFKDDGIAFGDAKAEQKAKEFLNSDSNYIAVSTSNFITSIRCLVYEGKFPHDKIVFLYKESFIHMDINARMEHRPIGFCDHTENWLFRLIEKRQK